MAGKQKYWGSWAPADYRWLIPLCPRHHIVLVINWKRPKNHLLCYLDFDWQRNRCDSKSKAWRSCIPRPNVDIPSLVAREHFSYHSDGSAISVTFHSRVPHLLVQWCNDNALSSLQIHHVMSIRLWSLVFGRCTLVAQAVFRIRNYSIEWLLQKMICIFRNLDKKWRRIDSICQNPGESSHVAWFWENMYKYIFILRFQTPNSREIESHNHRPSAGKNGIQNSKFKLSNSVSGPSNTIVSVSTSSPRNILQYRTYVENTRLATANDNACACDKDSRYRYTLDLLT